LATVFFLRYANVILAYAYISQGNAFEETKARFIYSQP